MVGANLGRRGPSFEMAMSSNAQSSCRDDGVASGTEHEACGER
jgi:hypothetical protein